MRGITVNDIVDWIERLGNDKTYSYYTKSTIIRIIDINKPEGPIKFRRWSKGKAESTASDGAISENQLATAASVFSRKPNYPIHFDRLFSAGGNSRSALETLLALTPNFFICYPAKTNLYNGKVEERLKHIMWCPDQAHTLGEIHTTNYTQVINEMEYELDFGDIKINETNLSNEFDSIEAKKTHTQMQVALIKIGNALNFRSWIAKNDRSIGVENSRLGDLPGVVDSLQKAEIFYSEESKELSSLIDCIWFTRDFRYIPAVIEIEHSTGVTSGLTRMLKLKEALPSVAMKFAIVADVDMRSKVLREANRDAFRGLKTRFISYNTVRELYGITQRYNLSDVVQQNFIDPFMEKMVDEK